MTPKFRRQSSRLIIVAVLLLAFALRLYRLDHQSLWNDEGNSARLSERAISLIIEGTAADVHPPFYYLLLAGSRQLIGASEFALRFVSVTAGLLTVAVTIALAKQLANQRVASIAGLFIAISPPLIYYSQEARMYSLLGLCATLSTFLLIRWWHTPTRWGLLVGYTLCATAGLYTHYSFPAILLAHNIVIALWLLIGYKTEAQQTLIRFGRWCGLMITTLILYSPWLPIFLRSQGQRPPGEESAASYILQTSRWLIVGANATYSGSYLILFVLLITVYTYWKDSKRLPLLILWLITPITLLGLAGATLPSYMKFFTVVVPPFWLLVALGVEALPQLRVPPIGRLILVAVLAWPMGNALNNLYHDPTYFRADYRAIAQQIEAEAHPTAAVILNAPNQWEVFTYYFKDVPAVYPLPRFVTNAENITAELEEIKQKHGRIYAIFWGSEGFDPDQVVERWLDANGFKAIDEWRGDLRFVMYALPGKTATQPTAATDLVFGNAEIQLEGWATGQEISEQQPGDILQLTLFWQAQQQLENRYKIFIHILNENGELVAQRDSEPVGNLAPTNTWSPNQTIIDNHGLLLPTDLPAGQYTLSIGMYDIADPAVRLPIQDKSGQITDTYSLTTFNLVNH